MQQVRSCIVDCQGYKLKNKFYFKELAVVSLDGRIIQNFLFEAPFEVWSCEFTDPKSVNWVTENHHRLNWNIGLIPYKYLNVILEKVNRTFKKIYVKGSEKRLWILPYKLPDVELVNFETEHPNCPPLRVLKSDRGCIFEHSNCALKNSFKILEWLLNSNSSDPLE